MSNANFQADDIRTESSWTGPLRILVMILILSGAFLYYYFGPTVEDIQGNNPRASTSEEPIAMEIGKAEFYIPENYTQFGRARRGGVLDKVDLYAILPDFGGYTVAYQEEFEGNAANSPIVHFSIQRADYAPRDLREHATEAPLSERQRFERVYLPHAANPDGEPAKFQFVRYELGESWGHSGQDLFVYEGSDGEFILFRCIEEGPDMPSPWCRRDLAFVEGVTISYRFKRARLSDWRKINDGLIALVESFRPSGTLRQISD